MGNLRSILVCIALFAAAAALASLAWLFWVASNEIPKIRPAVLAEVDRQATGIRADAVALVNAQAAEARQLLSVELKNTRSLVSSEMESSRRLVSSELEKTRSSASEIADTLDNRLSSIETGLIAQVTKAEGDLDARLGETNKILADTVQPVNEISRQIASAAPLFLDCENNADCLFNRYVGTARGTEKTSEAVGRIATDLSTLTHELTKPKPWYRHLTDFLKTGTVIAGLFY
jgi:hypothetical protein